MELHFKNVAERSEIEEIVQFKNYQFDLHKIINILISNQLFVGGLSTVTKVELANILLPEESAEAANSKARQDHRTVFGRSTPFVNKR